jgi:hypothetical protein
MALRGDNVQLFTAYITKYTGITVGRVSQLVWRLATGWMVWGSNPGGGEIFRACPHRPWGPPSLLYNGYRVFPGGRKRLTPHSVLVPRSSWPVKRVKPTRKLTKCFLHIQYPKRVKNTVLYLVISVSVVSAMLMLISVI